MKSTSMPALWIVLGILALCLYPIVLMMVGGITAKREDEQDIMTHGRTATGTVVAVDEIALGKGHAWKITVEFPVPEQSAPVRFEQIVPQNVFSKLSRLARELNPGQTVTLHYREKWPTLAIIDNLIT
jgi:hypothetical protein